MLFRRLSSQLELAASTFPWQRGLRPRLPPPRLIVVSEPRLEPAASTFPWRCGHRTPFPPRRWGLRSRDYRNRTVGSILIQISRAVAELWTWTSGGSGFCTHDGSSTLAVVVGQRRWCVRSRDDRTQTVGSIFVKIAPAVAELWASALAAGGGGGFINFSGGVCASEEARFWPQYVQ